MNCNRQYYNGILIICNIDSSFVSWYFWAKHRDQEITQKTMTKKLAMWQNLLCGLIIGGAAIVCHMVLVRIGGEYLTAGIRSWKQQRSMNNE